jgi:starvation-inducible outer membrane lipoprotein
MKKITSIILVLILAASLTSCVTATNELEKNDTYVPWWAKL